MCSQVNLEKDSSYWERVLWSDEAKLELTFRENREALNPNSTVPISGGSIMLCGCFSATGTGNLVKVEGIIKK